MYTTREDVPPLRVGQIWQGINQCYNITIIRPMADGHFEGLVHTPANGTTQGGWTYKSTIHSGRKGYGYPALDHDMTFDITLMWLVYDPPAP